MDFSSLKNIDFKNKDTVLFLIIFSVFVLAVIFVVFYFLAKILSLIVNLFRVKKGPRSFTAQGALSDEPAKHTPDIGTFKPKVQEPFFEANFKEGENLQDKQKNAVEAQKKKMAQKIAEGLSKLKSSAGKEKEQEQKKTLQDRMPSLNGDKTDEPSQEIHIPRAKKFSSNGSVISDNGSDDSSQGIHISRAKKFDSNNEQVVLDDKQPSAPVNLKDAVSVLGPSKAATATNRGVLQPENIFQDQVHIDAPAENKKDNILTPEKPAEKDIFGAPILKKEEPKRVQQDNTIFGGKDEISRISLRYKLMKDPSVAKAQRELRMNLSPVERVKLEKELFAPVYGRNISKKDLNLTIKKMGRNWASASDPKKKETLRKQIKFLKKIGGVK